MSSEQIKITLPNGDVLELPEGSTSADVAAAIGPGLAKAAVAAQIPAEGDSWETIGLMEPLEGDTPIKILTSRDPESLAVLRHSAAHVLATAVRELRPGAGIGFGPAIDDGFYYDFDVDAPFTPEDLGQIRHPPGFIVAFLRDQSPGDRPPGAVKVEERAVFVKDDPLDVAVHVQCTCSAPGRAYCACRGWS